MPLTPAQLAGLTVVLCAAGAVQGMSGFGFGLIAVALLGSIVPLKQASVMLVLASLCLNLYILFRLRKNLSWQRMNYLLGATVVGVPLGVWLLVQADERLFRQVLGIVLLLTVVQQLVPFVRAKRWHPVWIGVPCGLFSGALSGAFATGGPPAVAYVQSQRFDRFQYAAAVQVPLAVAAVVRVACLGATGMFTRDLLALSGVAAVCAVSGAWFGLHVLKRLRDHAVRKVVVGMLLLLGIKYMVWS